MYNQPEDLPVDSCIVDLAYCISLDIKDAFVIFQVFFVKQVIPSDSQKGLFCIASSERRTVLSSLLFGHSKMNWYSDSMLSDLPCWQILSIFLYLPV